ncbi:MAG: metallophosphoesterase [Lachnospiraceae bacterium]
MNKKNRIILSIILILFILFTLSYFLSKYGLTVTSYTISSGKIASPLRIVQLTDLHNSIFGKDNERLFAKVTEQSPDLIFLTGDMINAEEQDISGAVKLVERLSALAPVYISYGNHEKDYETQWQKDLTEVFEQAGAHVLKFSYEDIEVNGQKLRIGGLYGYCTPAKYLATKEADPEECAFLEDFQSSDSYTMLLTHMPFTWIFNDGISEWEVDGVFAGHDHGGQIRIPLIGGLYAPDQGWFPGKDCGLYYSGDGEKVMILSRGLGSSWKIPRLNNIPEIAVVDLLPEKD